MSGASMPSAKRSLGGFGERIAADYLARRGYTIIDRNWRCSLGEIDLVARMGDQVVFIEVRTRRDVDGAFAPEESLGRAKRRRLVQLAQSYVEAAAIPAEQLWRIDLIALRIDLVGRLVALNHIESAVEEEV